MIQAMPPGNSILHAAIGLTSLTNGSPSSMPANPGGDPVAPLPLKTLPPAKQPQPQGLAPIVSVPRPMMPPTGLPTGMMPPAGAGYPYPTMAAQSMRPPQAPAAYGALAPRPALGPMPQAAPPVGGPAPSAALASLGGMPDRFVASAPIAHQYQAQAGAMLGYPPSYPGLAGLQSTMQMPLAPVPNTKSFPETLYDIISLPQNQHIVSWLPHGKGFIIHDKRRFASIILPRYFDGTKFTSFTRRLNRWSFTRVPRGPEMGAYYNPHFVRGRPELVAEMKYKMEGFDEARLARMRDESRKKKETKRKAEAQASKPSDEKKKEGEEEKENDESEAKTDDAKTDAKAAEPKKKKAKTASPKPAPAGQIVYANEYKPQIPSHLLAPGHDATALATALPLPSSLPKTTAGAATTPPNGHIVTPSSPSEQLRMMELQREMLLRQVPPIAVGPPGTTTAMQRRASFHAQEQLLHHTERVRLQTSYAAAAQGAQRSRSNSHHSLGSIAGMLSAVQQPPSVAPMAAPVAAPAPAGHGEQPVMMSKKEQEEFAEYLLMKRKGSI